MQTNSNPLRICHKLFNFIITSFIGKKLKHITMGHSPLCDYESEGLLINIEGLSSTNHLEKTHQKYHAEPELMVDFNHDSGVRTDYDHEIQENVQAEQGKVRNKKKQNYKGLSSTNHLEKTNLKYNVEPEVMVEFNHHIGPEKWTQYDHEIQAIVQPEEGKVRNNQKEKEMKLPNAKLFLYDENEDDHKMSPRRFFLYNINEKAEAFIRDKREAIRKSITLDNSLL